jgi:SPP1 gp7 family putative phage head morphogenesis protein
MASSALFKRLGRQGRNRNKELAQKLAPKIPRTERVLYDRKLRAFMNLWRDAVMSDLRLHRLDGDRRVPRGVRQDARPLLTATYQQLLENSRLGDFLEGLGNRVTGKAQKYMRDVVRIPVQMRGKEQLLADFRSRNIALIKDLGHEQVEKLDVLLLNAHTSGVRNEDLAPEVAKVLDVGESRAALIARDQILKMNSNAQQLAQTEAGIEEYVWATSEDERVRESHRALDGKTFAWSDPPSPDDEPVHPGEAINCRCVPVPVIPLFAGI